MDELVQHLTSGDDTTSYSLPEIWHFPLTSNANATMDIMNREHDPMLADTFNQDAQNVNANSSIINNETDFRRMKRRGGNGHGESKKQGEENCGGGGDKTGNPSEPPKQDYIHVRARRGQATDSHSLAERARREKISERMKILQDLVPGCNKVIGKALVLDEIINYIQSLQRQVEFLSLKIEAVNSRVPPGIESFPSKEFAQQQAYEASSLGFSSQAASGYEGTSPEWLHMQLGGGFERTS